MGYNYLVLHQAEDAVYGTDFSVRWFEGLQKNGVYIGSSGSDDNAYYQMAFRNGRFEQQELGHKEGSQCEIAGKAVTEKAFEAWKAETMTRSSSAAKDWRSWPTGDSKSSSAPP